MNKSPNQNTLEGKTLQEQHQDPLQNGKQSFSDQNKTKKTLTKKKRLRLARLKRIRQLEIQKNSFSYNVYDLFPSFSLLQYNFKSLFSIELNSFLFSLIFIVILTFSSNLGLYFPSRFEITSLNTSLKIGFFEHSTKFQSNFNFTRKHSKFFFYFEFKKKEDPFGIFDSDTTNQIDFKIRHLINESSRIIKRSSTSIIKYNDTGVQPLVDIILDEPTNLMNLSIEFKGDLTNYKTFFLRSIVYNTDYFRLLKYYRLIFLTIGVIFIFHSKFPFLNFPHIQIAGIIIIIVNSPTFIFNIETSAYGYFIQKILDQLFSHFILFGWVYDGIRKVYKKYFSKYLIYEDIFTKMFSVILIFIEVNLMVNILASFNSEAKNTYNYLADGIQNTDTMYLFWYAVLIIGAYSINVAANGGQRLGVLDFFILASQLCAFCDDLVERCKVLKCIDMAKWMRVFTEPVAFFLLVVQPGSDESELSDKSMVAVPLDFDEESSASKKGGL